MFAVFMQHYSYTANEALNEYAKRFFALCAQMYRNKAISSLDLISNVSASMDGKANSGYIDILKKQAEGNDKMIQEAKTIRGIK